MTDATRYAILNANYIKARLEPHYPVLYTRANGRVAHEMIFDLRAVQAARGIDETDVAKRLMDYGFHAPTVSFPVAGHADGRADRERAERGARSLLRRDDRDPRGDRGRDRRQGRSEGQRAQERAAHGGRGVADDEWTHPYSREQAAFPLPFVRARQVLAERRAHRQSVRRPQPVLRRARRSRPTRDADVRPDCRGRCSAAATAIGFAGGTRSQQRARDRPRRAAADRAIVDARRSARPRASCS